MKTGKDASVTYPQQRTARSHPDTSDADARAGEQSTDHIQFTYTVSHTSGKLETILFFPSQSKRLDACGFGLFCFLVTR